MRQRSWVHVALPRNLVVVGCLIVASAAPAVAGDPEVVFAVNRIQIHTRPGEAAPIVGHAEDGDELEVIGDRGRWLKVRNGKKVGWVTRTEVAPTKPAEPRGRAQRTGFSGKPVSDAVKVTVEIDRVRGFDDPRTKANNVLDLARGDVVTVIGRGHGGWLMVEHDSGGVGWIPAAAVSDAGRFAGDPRKAPAEVARPAAGAKPPAVVAAAPVARRSAAPWMRAALVATAGAQTFQMRQSGDGEATANASGPMATIAAAAQLHVRGDIWAGVGTSAELGTADLIYYGATETSPSMATRELAVDAYAEIRLGGLPYVAARGGIHYATLSVDSDRAEPMLVGERIAGATVGLAGAVALGRRLSLSASADVMPAGAQRMSSLAPGTMYATTVRGAWVRGTLAMPLPAHLVAALSYRFGALTAQLTDAGAEPKTGTRTDQSHVVTAGLGVAW